MPPLPIRLQHYPESMRFHESALQIHLYLLSPTLIAPANDRRRNFRARHRLKQPQAAQVGGVPVRLQFDDILQGLYGKSIAHSRVCHGDPAAIGMDKLMVAAPLSDQSKPVSPYGPRDSAGVNTSETGVIYTPQTVTVTASPSETAAASADGKGLPSSSKSSIIISNTSLM